MDLAVITPGIIHPPVPVHLLRADAAPQVIGILRLVHAGRHTAAGVLVALPLRQVVVPTYLGTMVPALAEA